MSNDDNDEKLLVSGPTNALRLEGKIDNVEKILYLFTDYHLPLLRQTHCDTDKYYDIVNYFVDNFKDNKEKINFFLEIEDFVGRSRAIRDRNNKENQDYRKDTQYFEMYIFRIRNFFAKYFNYDPEKNIVKSNKPYEHILFHYTDFRWSFKFLNNMYQNIRETLFRINYQELQFIFEDLTMMAILIKSDYDFLYNTTKEKAKEIISQAPKISSLDQLQNLPMKDISLLMYKYYYKILYNYENPHVEKVILDIINDQKIILDNFLKTINEILETINNRFHDYDQLIQKNNGNIPNHQCQNFIEFGMTVTEYEKFFFNLIIKLGNAYDQWSIVNVELMDCYFLRRFLDKNYAKKNLVYAGGHHCSNYVYTLIKHFDFKLTHYSYLKFDYEQSIEKIKNHCVHEIIIPPENFKQCSDMSSFPKNFE